MDDTTIANPIDTTIANPITNTAVLDTEPDNDVLVDALLEDELLVEEISIDGMCGVY